MSCQIINNAGLDLTDLQSHLDGMYDHFNQKLGFQKPPVIVFDTDPSNQSNVLGKTAYYDPQSLEIHIFIDGRHPKDMLRSIAHELIHHQQNLEGRLNVGGYNGPGYYLKNDKMKEIEQEAMLEGNAILREYEDTVKHTENKNMSLKEWKNNELNQLLMKKFGILKENKKPDFLDLDKDGDKDESMADAANTSKGEDKEVQEESVSGRKEDSDRRQGKDREHSDRLREDDVSEGKECDKCEAEECKCEKIEEGSSTPDKLREAIRRISKAKKVFLNNKRIR